MSDFIDKLDKRLIFAFLLGIIMSGTGLKVLAVFDPSGAASKLQASMCGEALGAMVQEHSDKIMACVADKSRCEGKLDILDNT